MVLSHKDVQNNVPASVPITSTDSTTTTATSTAPSQPPIPPTPPISSMSLHDFKIAQSPLPLSSYLYPVFDQSEDPLDRLPYETQMVLKERGNHCHSNNKPNRY